LASEDAIFRDPRNEYGEAGFVSTIKSITSPSVIAAVHVSFRPIADISALTSPLWAKALYYVTFNLGGLQSMRVKLPKPLHGWREFAGEVGVIVLGVLIALIAQQLVQQWQWRQETSATRDALRREAADNLDAALQRSQQQPCVEQRLKEIATIFAAHKAGEAINLRRSVGRPVSYYGRTETWQVEVASQSLSHMPLDEKLAFAKAFGNYENLNSVLRLEQDFWLRLNVLNAPDQLEPGDWPPLRQAYAQALSLSARLKIITADILGSVTLGQRPAQFGSTPDAVTLARREFCKPLLQHSALHQN